MPICVSCRVPHHSEDCEDTQQGRRGFARQCYCQHKPRPASRSELMNEHATYEDAAELVDGLEPVGVGDLLDDPRTNAEALCLCALLWTTTTEAAHVVDALVNTDFEKAVYGELFETIATQVRAGRPHDPASIAAALTQGGRAAGHRGQQLARALTAVTMAGGSPEAAGHYAITVVSAAYRRGFHTAAVAMTEAAGQLSQDQLFDHLLSIGCKQRAATERLHTITHTLS